MARRVLLLLVIVVSTALVPASPAQAANCQFVLGFKVLHDLIPATVGTCLTNEYYNDNGDGVQQTAGTFTDGRTGGLLVWRKADNWTAFTDGNRTWINGPFGVESRFNVQRFYWEPDYATAGANQTPGEIADAAMGAVEKVACASVNTNVTLTTPQQVACSAIRYWTIRPPVSVSAVLVAPLNDIRTWPEGQQLLSDASSIGVSYVADSIPAPPGTDIFGYFDLTNHQIHINTNDMQGANDWVIAGILVHELRHASDYAHGSLLHDTAVHCYATELRAFLTQGQWYQYAQGNLGHTSGPMVAQLFDIYAHLYILQKLGTTGNQAAYDYWMQLTLNDWLGPYEETCGNLP